MQQDEVWYLWDFRSVKLFAAGHRVCNRHRRAAAQVQAAAIQLVLVVQALVRHRGRCLRARRVTGGRVSRVACCNVVLRAAKELMLQLLCRRPCSRAAALQA